MIISHEKQTAQVKVADSKTFKPKPPKKPLRQFNRWAIALLAAGLLAVPITMYIVNQHSKPKENPSNSLTVPVEAKNLTVRITASGTVQPVQRVNMSPKSSGRIAELYVEQGDRVEKGQLIARMESRDIEAQLMQSQARLASAIARLEKLQAGNRPEEITQAQARLDQIQANLARLQAGTRSEEIAQSEASLNEAKARLANAQSGSLLQEIAQAKSQIEANKATAELTMQRLQRNRNLLEEGAISQDQFEVYQKEDRIAKANVQEAEKRLKQLQENRRSQIQQLQAAVEQQQQLLKEKENGTRPEEITKAEAEVAEAKSKLAQLVNGTRPEEIASAKADVAEVKAQVRYYEVQIEDTKIRAPFAGIITQRYALQGAFVTPTTSASTTDTGSSTSIVALAQDLEVLAKVTESDIGQIKPGQTVEIIADAYPDKVFSGRVKLIAPEAVKDRDVTLFQVRVAIDKGKDLLQSGMNVDLKFLGEKLNNALVLPTVAIVTSKGKTGVLIPNEKNQPKFQPVTIGSTIGNKIQILEGLKAGDRVFLELPEGQKLEDIIKNRK
ncbi:efflux transporter periplasmic adaptor subunit [Oscillatoriales cyanobacterium USR001]|nr:efflux transporter periplasmic adaptor subunit [Oscillatoriales cyanobacterium USR001]